MKKFYLTTPIYYINDKPHIGHAYTTVAADVLARFHKLLGDETYFLTGTDEHGAKVFQASQKAKKDPKEFADEIAGDYKKAWEQLEIKYARFIGTTDKDHDETVQKFLQKLYEKNYLVERNYEGFYCIGCERFLTEDELVDGKCPEHNCEPVLQKEKNWFFKLSEFSDRLLKIIESDEYEIKPVERKNEVLGKIKKGLEDISISRATLKWGIPLPFDKSQTCYVWVDALLNYYTFGHQKNIWPADLHIIGKDILWFHAIIWPAMLLAAEEKLPKKLFVHGYFTIGGKKMSKTLGNIITPQELVEKFGANGTRYLLLSAYPFGGDGDITIEKFKEKYNADLAGGLGNLASRVAKLCNDLYLDNPITGWRELKDFVWRDKIGKLITTPFDKDFINGYKRCLDNLDFFGALNEINNEISRIDKSINEDRPWELVKTNKDEARKVLTLLVLKINQLATLLEPFMPSLPENLGKYFFSGPIKKIEEPLFKRVD